MVMARNPLHIFMIPSTYPSVERPVEGIFFREQAVALGRVRPEWKVSVSLWAQGDATFSVREPRTWRKSVRAAVHEPARRELRTNVVEYRRPALAISDRVPGAGHAVVRANSANVREAVQELGPVDIIHAHGSYPGG